jgi:hypothetical protein
MRKLAQADTDTAQITPPHSRKITSYLKKHAEQGGTFHILEPAFSRYRSGYAARYKAWLSAHCRYTSSMIALDQQTIMHIYDGSKCVLSTSKQCKLRRWWKKSTVCA